MTHQCIGKTRSGNRCRRVISGRKRKCKLHSEMRGGEVILTGEEASEVRRDLPRRSGNITDFQLRRIVTSISSLYSGITNRQRNCLVRGLRDAPYDLDNDRSIERLKRQVLACINLRRRLNTRIAEILRNSLYAVY